MLFQFGKFWKTVGLVALTWGGYALCGFEFIVVTMIALLYAEKFTDDHTIL